MPCLILAPVAADLPLDFSGKNIRHLDDELIGFSLSLEVGGEIVAVLIDHSVLQVSFSFTFEVLFFPLSDYRIPQR